MGAAPVQCQDKIGCWTNWVWLKEADPAPNQSGRRLSLCERRFSACGSTSPGGSVPATLCESLLLPAWAVVCWLLSSSTHARASVGRESSNEPLLLGAESCSSESPLLSLPPAIWCSITISRGLSGGVSKSGAAKRQTGTVMGILISSSVSKGTTNQILW